MKVKVHIFNTKKDAERARKEIDDDEDAHIRFGEPGIVTEHYADFEKLPDGRYYIISEKLVDKVLKKKAVEIELPDEEELKEKELPK